MSECERCSELESRIYRLSNVIDELNADLGRARDSLDTAEGQINDLKPYKEASDRAYDHYVTTPRDMP